LGLPSLHLFAFETTGEALGGRNGKKGIYMQLGFAPGYTFFAESAYPTSISLAHDLRVGASNYTPYNGEKSDVRLLLVGAALTMPLKFIPANFGSVVGLKAGVQFLVLNTNLKKVNTGGDAFVPIGSVAWR